MFEDVYSEPQNDKIRLRVGEVLAKRGDKRGDFILLQLSADPESLAQATALASQVGRLWWDGLDHDGAMEVSWTRGFPSTVTATSLNCRRKAWATVEQVFISDRHSELLGTMRLVSLRGIHGLCPTRLSSLKLPFPESIDHLGLVLGPSWDTGMGVDSNITPKTVELQGDLVSSSDLMKYRFMQSVKGIGMFCSLDALGEANRFLRHGGVEEVAVYGTFNPLESLMAPRWAAMLHDEELELVWRGEPNSADRFLELADIMRSMEGFYIERVQLLGHHPLMLQLVRTMEPIFARWPGKPQVFATL